MSEANQRDSRWGSVKDTYRCAGIYRLSCVTSDASHGRERDEEVEIWEQLVQMPGCLDLWSCNLVPVLEVGVFE